jgi:serine/threonine-protein phosphatase 2A regulatory subunit B''
LFKKYYQELLTSTSSLSISPSSTTPASLNVIPQFYFKLPEHNTLAQKLREEARTLFLQKRSKELLDNNELKILWNLLEKYHQPPTISDEQFITYDNYLKVVQLAGEKFE